MWLDKSVSGADIVTPMQNLFKKNKPKNLRTQLYLSTETLFPQKVYRKLAGKAAVALSQIGNLSSSIGNKRLHNTIMRL